MNNLTIYSESVDITPKISIRIPTVGEIMGGDEIDCSGEAEANYYSLVMSLTAMPIDMMVALDDMGIDFTTINEYDLFLLLFPGIALNPHNLVFGDLDLKKFQIELNDNTNLTRLVDYENDIIIDRAVYNKISTTLRKIHNLEKNTKRPGNKEARDFLIEIERKKMKRRKNQPHESQLEDLIVAMVNTEQFKYNYEETKNLSIYQFNRSVSQIMSKVNYQNLMHGVYAGTVDSKHLKHEDFNWVTHK